MNELRQLARLKLDAYIAAFGVLVILIAPHSASARKKKPAQPPDDDLQQYIQTAKAGIGGPQASVGSLWTPNGPYSTLARDDKAYRPGDMVTINIQEQLTAATTGNVKTSRAFNASSSLGAFIGQIPANSGLQNLFSPTSNSALNGQAQTASSSLLNTSLEGLVVAVLPNGYLVVQAERQVNVDSQWQHVILRGVVRPSDISPANTIPSTAISNLQVEVQGKGVISDNTRQPNRVVRLIMKVVGF